MMTLRVGVLLEPQYTTYASYAETVRRVNNWTLANLADLGRIMQLPAADTDRLVWPPATSRAEPDRGAARVRGGQAQDAGRADATLAGASCRLICSGRSAF